MKKLYNYILFFLFVVISFVLKVSAENYPFNGMISSGTLVVHNAANLSGSSAVTEIVYGTRVTVTGKPAKNIYSITYDGGSGYVSSNYVKNVDENILTTSSSGVESYETYCSYLGKNNIPSSYCPYLYYLHVKHPSWIFKGDKVGMTLEAAGKGEEWKSALETDNKNYHLEGATPFECSDSGCYYYVRGNVIASVMDPRNSLYEDLIFQFFDSDDNKDLSSADTISYLVGDGNLKQYISIFNEAASQNGINVVQLVSRSKQEGANKAGYSSIAGTYICPDGYTCGGYDLNGYYNFYNIGAWTEKGVFTPSGRGLAYAAGYIGGTSYGRPWNTPEKAIKGGADFLTRAYIKAGQDTIYYQKFNVSPRSGSKFTNQYMTNSNAPSTEGAMMFSTYKNSKSLDQPFIFSIPVYDDMGDIYQAVNKDSNSKLSAVYIDGKLIPGFDKDVTEPGTINFQTSNNKINVTAVAESATTKINGLGEYTFSGGNITIKLYTVAEDGSSTTYVYKLNQVGVGGTITVDNVVNNMDVKINNNIMYGISPSVDASTLINTVLKNGGNASINSSNGTAKTSGALATGDVITISGSNETKSYTISVRGDLSGDGAVKINDLVMIQSHILGKINLNTQQFYAGDLGYDNEIKINDLVVVQSYILGKLSL